MRKGVLVLGVVAVVAGLALYLYWRRDGVARVQRSPAAEPQIPSPVPVPSPSADLGILVSAPGRHAGSVGVAIIANGGVEQVRCRVNGAPTMWRRPSSGRVTFAVVRWESAPESLRNSCTLPRPVEVDFSRAVQERVELRFGSRSGARSATVRALAEGEPVSGVRVSLRLRANTDITVASGKTDAEGLIGFEGLHAANYSVTLESWPKGVARVGNSGLGLPLRARRHKDITFRFRRSGSLRIHVRCPDGAKGPQPVAIYEVREQKWDRLWAFKGLDTDAEGRCGIEEIPTGQYWITTWGPGLEPATATIRIRAGATHDVVLRPRRGSSAVRARLVAATGRPLRTRRVNLNAVPDSSEPNLLGKGVVPDERGDVRWEGVIPGEYQMILWDERVMRRLVVPQDGDLDLGNQPVPARDSGKCEYVSRVVFSDGKPVANIWVGYRAIRSRTPWFRFCRTQGDGVFRVRGLTAGEFHVWLEPGGHFEGFRRTPAVRVVVSPESTYRDLVLRE